MVTRLLFSECLFEGFILRLVSHQKSRPLRAALLTLFQGQTLQAGGSPENLKTNKQKKRMLGLVCIAGIHCVGEYLNNENKS